ncbi:MAG TPA: hypothetical protein VFF28_07835, partial [Candidatus Nanoarchaeia archaeon]|nr:hypothetical protein [Candidatus Nanoarchaeia archaeon]
MDKIQKRQVAYKTAISDILKADYVKEEGEWVPNYVKIGDKKVSRVNILAVVVGKQNIENTNYQGMLIDDGSGKISVRSFERSFDLLNVGDFVLVIGRPREYFNEKYIVAEIARKMENPLWAELRKIEINKVACTEEELAPVQEDAQEATPFSSETINQKIFELIREIDSG